MDPIEFALYTLLVAGLAFVMFVILDDDGQPPVL